MVSQDFRRQLEGYGLTTANILYRRPDHPWLLQSYVWQNFDLFPKFPELHKFLNFWIEKLDGPLHSVTVAHALASFSPCLPRHVAVRRRQSWVAYLPSFRCKIDQCPAKRSRFGCRRAGNPDLTGVPMYEEEGNDRFFQMPWH